MLGAVACERTQVAHEGAQEIFQGVWYTVEEMPGSNEAEGAVHLVRVDVQSEEIELFATPVADTSATGAPRYPLRLTSLVARREGLAVAINGSLFERPRWGYWPGAMVRGLHTVVSDGEPSHVHPHSYLLWMDNDRQLHVERSKPPSLFLPNRGPIQALCSTEAGRRPCTSDVMLRAASEVPSSEAGARLLRTSASAQTPSPTIVKRAMCNVERPALRNRRPTLLPCCGAFHVQRTTFDIPSFTPETSSVILRLSSRSKHLP